MILPNRSLSIAIFLLLFLLNLVSAKLVLAQMPFAFDETATPTHLATLQIKSTPVAQKFFGFINPFKPNATDTYLATHLKSSLEYYTLLAKKTDVTCTSSSAHDYTIGLAVTGEYKKCQDFVKSCLAADTFTIPIQIQGARCFALDYNYVSAREVFSALGASIVKTNDRTALTLEFAAMAMSSQFSSELESILNSNAAWTADEKNLAKGLIEFYVLGRPLHLSKQAVFDFLDQQIATADNQAGGYLEKYLKSLRVFILSKDYQFQKSYDYLIQDAIKITNPLDWWSTGFNVLYAFSDGKNFDIARNFYLNFIPFAHSRSSGLPTERNTYNYKEMSESACFDTLLQGPKKDEFDQAVNLWKSGQNEIKDLIETLEDSGDQFLKKSDVQSTLGSLYAISGNPTKARQSYWQSHELCPFNNRSHWGLILLERQIKYKAFPEFSANEKFVVDTIQNITYPIEINKYILNWDSFPEESKNRIKYASRIWADYMMPLSQFGSFAYIKIPYQKLSEIPTFEDLKNKRIGPPDLPNHLFDNRLWDDVRGAGGKNVAADHDEVFMAVHGDYNLLGHEMAHSFHYFLELKRPESHDCLLKLYANALSKNTFPDGYSKTNYKEYFAQGITYYLIPDNFPSRYGFNRSWYKTNDPDLYSFIVSIENSKGDVNSIVCPLK